jgi:hypothetical protein
VKGIPARTSLSCYRVSKERCPVWPGDFPLCNFIVTLSNSVYPAILMNGWACLSFRHIIPRGVELRMATGIFTNRRNLTPGFRLLAQAFLLKHPHPASRSFPITSLIFPPPPSFFLRPFLVSISHFSFACHPVTASEIISYGFVNSENLVRSVIQKLGPPLPSIRRLLRPLFYLRLHPLPSTRMRTRFV